MFHYLTMGQPFQFSPNNFSFFHYSMRFEFPHNNTRWIVSHHSFLSFACTALPSRAEHIWSRREEKVNHRWINRKHFSENNTIRIMLTFCVFLLTYSLTYVRPGMAYIMGFFTLHRLFPCRRELFPFILMTILKPDS